MSYNYDSLLGKMIPRKKTGSKDAAHAVPIERGTLSSVQLFLAASVLSLFGAANASAQTTIIDPATQGGFNSGSTFEANGWKVANEGSGPLKWFVGTAASGTTAVGDTTVSSTTLILTAANPNIIVGQAVYGANIPDNTLVTAINGTTITLSQNATATASSVTFGFAKSTGGISVATTQLTSASIAANTYSINLAVANPNISVGMLITSPGVIDTNTYVASINGTALGLSRPTLNTAALTAAQTLAFAPTTAAISGNAAYVTNDNGITNSMAGSKQSRTIYFYRDITNIPAAESAMTLSFDAKTATTNSSSGWQVWVAPITQPVVGSNTQSTTSNGTYPPILASAVPGAIQIACNIYPQVATTRMTAFIPKSFAGTPFRLIFQWSNNSNTDTPPPAAIDNISLISRVPQQITCAHSGLWSQPSTWDGNKVPTPADSVTLDNDGEAVIIDSRYSGCQDLSLTGPNTLMQFAMSSVIDEFTVYNDFHLSGNKSRFNNHENSTGTNGGKFLKVGHDINVAATARFDSSIGPSSSNMGGRLILNGSSLQTVTVDPAGFMGGVTATNISTNLVGVLNQLEVTNTSTVSPNVKWNANAVRIKGQLILTTGRVSVPLPNRLILGNFTSMDVTIPPGYGFTDGTISKWISNSNTAVVQPGTEYPGADKLYANSWYPFIGDAGQNKSLYLLPDASPAIAGEVAVTYTNASGLTNLSVNDGSYTINKRWDGNWKFSIPDGNATTGAAVYFSPGVTGSDTTATGMAATTTTVTLAAANTAILVGQLVSGLNIAPNTYVSAISSTTLTLSQPTTNTAAITVAVKLSFSASSLTTATGMPATATVVTLAAANANIVAGQVVTGTNIAPGTSVSAISGTTLTLSQATTNTSAISAAVTLNFASAFRVGVTAIGSYEALDGTSRLMNASAPMAGIHQDGTSQPFAFRKSLTLNDLTALPIFVGIGNSSVLNTDAAITSATSGDWNTPSTWVGNVVPTCTNVVNIASGHNVTVTTAATAASIIIKQGATLTNNSGTNTMTVGSCGNNNNNAPFNNYGTYTMTAGNLKVNGFVSHKAGSFFNQTGGEIIIDSNNNGDAATSVAFGGSSLKIETANLALTDGKITIVDPLVNLGTPITQQTLTFTGANVGSTNTLTLSAANTAIIAGLPVSGTGIKPGTFVVTVSGTTLTLSDPIQADATSPLTVTFYPNTVTTSGSFVYRGPANYAAGLNHTLQIGDGVSNQKGALVTYGFNCVFQNLGIQQGTPVIFSLGNLTVNAPDGDNRFMSTNSLGNGSAGWGALNVQNQLKITSGSTLKKLFGASSYYLGGNIVNDGSFLMPSGSTSLFVTYLGNFINGVAVPTTLPQTISGAGVWSNNQYGSAYPAGSVVHFTVNNTSAQGVTLAMPSTSNFRVVGVLNLINGIIHTTNPLFVGNADVTSTLAGGSFSSTSGSATSYIDGPIDYAFPNTSSVSTFINFPTGKNGKYLPISVGTSGGVDFKIEAFDTNAGTVNGDKASGLSAARWKVSRQGTAGTFSGYQVKVANATTPITASSVLVQAPTDEGTYDIIKDNKTPSFIGTATPPTVGMTVASQKTSATLIAPSTTSITLDTANTDIILGQLVTGTNIAANTTVSGISGTALTLSTATTNTAPASAPITLTFQGAPAESFKGNFAYATKDAACTGVPAPGATIASSSADCSGAVALSLANATVGSNVTYQWQSSLDNGSTWADITAANAATYGATSANTSYRCNVTCSGSTTASTKVDIAMPASAATVTGVTLCTPGTANLTASGSTILNWYDAAAGGNLVKTGTAFSPNVSQTTTYYVASGTLLTNTANATNYTGTNVGSTVYNGIAFDANKKITLKTVRVYPQNTSPMPITVALYDATGAIVSGTNLFTFTPNASSGPFTQTTTATGIPATGTTVTLAAANSGITVGQVVGGANIAPNTTVAAISGTTLTLSSPSTNTADITIPVTLTFSVPQDLQLNYDIPVGKGYKLVATYGLATINALGNSTSAITYPTTVGSLVLTGNVTNLTAAPVTTSNTTTYFYNLTFTETCEASRLPVVATVMSTVAPTGEAVQATCTVGTIADFIVTGATGATFTWYDAATLGTVIPKTTKAVLDTTYYVSQTISGCEGPRLAVKASGPCLLGTDDLTVAELRYYPNPVSDQLTITAKDAITKVEVYNLLGQQLRVLDANSDNIQINFNMYPPSTYLIKVYSENKTQIFKVIKK